MLVVTNGLPVRLAVTAGEAHDNRLAGKLLSRLKSGTILLADRGYDANWIRALVLRHDAWANIPPKRNRTEALCISPYLYRARNSVERFFNKIKHCRRVATLIRKSATSAARPVESRCGHHPAGALTVHHWLTMTGEGARLKSLILAPFLLI